MKKILGSRKDFSNVDNNYVAEFLSIIKDILPIEDFQKLDNFNQHAGTTRKQHCLNVAYYTYRWSKKANLDYVSATRGALLHDFFLYDWMAKEKQYEGKHPEVHPVIALENASKYIEVNSIIEDCILHHMWPVTRIKPTTKEGMIVQAADKYCATLEVSKNSYLFIKPRVKNLFVNLLSNN